VIAPRPSPDNPLFLILDDQRPLSGFKVLAP
jgi:hypothetical protein